jgi:hypothetical protein
MQMLSLERTSKTCQFQHHDSGAVCKITVLKKETTTATTTKMTASNMTFVGDDNERFRQFQQQQLQHQQKQQDQLRLQQLQQLQHQQKQQEQLRLLQQQQLQHQQKQQEQLRQLQAQQQPVASMRQSPAERREFTKEIGAPISINTIEKKKCRQGPLTEQQKKRYERQAQHEREMREDQAELDARRLRERVASIAKHDDDENVNTKNKRKYVVNILAAGDQWFDEQPCAVIEARRAGDRYEWGQPPMTPMSPATPMTIDGECF